MKTTPGPPGLNAQATWNQQVREQLRRLRSLIPIASGKVVGNTLHAALLKAAGHLELQVQARQLRRPERGKSKLQPGGVISRWTPAQTGRKAEA